MMKEAPKSMKWWAAICAALLVVGSIGLAGCPENDDVDDLDDVDVAKVERVETTA